MKCTCEYNICNIHTNNTRKVQSKNSNLLTNIYKIKYSNFPRIFSSTVQYSNEKHFIFIF